MELQTFNMETSPDRNSPETVQEVIVVSPERSNEDEITQVKYQANFVKGTSTVLILNAAYVSGCSDDIREIRRNKEKKYEVTISDMEKAIIAWKGVWIKGFDDNESYTNGGATYENTRVYTFDVSGARVVCDGQDGTIIPENCNIDVIEEGPHDDELYWNVVDNDERPQQQEQPAPGDSDYCLNLFLYLIFVLFWAVVMYIGYLFVKGTQK